MVRVGFSSYSRVEKIPLSEIAKYLPEKKIAFDVIWGDLEIPAKRLLPFAVVALPQSGCNTKVKVFGTKAIRKSRQSLDQSNHHHEKDLMN